MKVAVTISVLVVLVGTALAAEPKGLGGMRGGYRASLNAANQGPAGGAIPISNGKAEFSLEVDEMAQSAKYSFWIAAVEGYTMSHIHVGAFNQNGPVAILLLPGRMGSANLTGLPMLAPFDICTTVYTATFTSADLITGGGANITWAQFLTNLKTGNLYVNVHTQKYPAGVIRGQLKPAPFTLTKCPKTKTWWTAQDLSGAAEPLSSGNMPANAMAAGPMPNNTKTAGAMTGMPMGTPASGSNNNMGRKL